MRFEQGTKQIERTGSLRCKADLFAWSWSLFEVSELANEYLVLFGLKEEIVTVGSSERTLRERYNYR